MAHDIIVSTFPNAQSLWRVRRAGPGEYFYRPHETLLKVLRAPWNRGRN